jgi:hypothetical protein
MNDPTADDARPRGMSEAGENAALDALTAEWGDEYEIYLTGDQWQAWHSGAPLQDMLAGATPGELNAAIRADWTRRER